jgi:hypothetical protein
LAVGAAVKPERAKPGQIVACVSNPAHREAGESRVFTDALAGFIRRLDATDGERTLPIFHSG